jgi:mRNA-degrading endonuclease RelE of RelBE toxin-antitoxin system
MWSGYGPITGEHVVAYRIEYTPQALEHLRRFSTRDQRNVVNSVDRQLQQEPLVSTRNRKPLRPNELASWELRVGHLRVFYDVLTPDTDDRLDNQPTGESTVSILAIGIKKGNRLLIGGEEIEL